MSGFTAKFGAYLMSFLWNVGVSAAKNGYLSICFFTMSWRIILKRQRRAEPFVSILCTVISKSKSSRPIGTRKSLGYCKSLDCVAAVLRGIEKSEKGRCKGKRKRGQLFFISASFPFTPLHLSPRLCICHANCHAGYCEIYIFTLAWLWFVCSTARIRIAVHLWTCSTRITSLWPVVTPLCRTAIVRRYYKLVTWMLSCYHAICQSSRIRTKNRRSRLTVLTLMWFLWDVKEPTPLLEKSRGRRPRCCGKPSHITSITPWVGWVQ